MLAWIGTGSLFLAQAGDAKAARVKKLIQQLDDKEFAQREAAKSELIKLGLDILPYLPETDAKLSPEQIKSLNIVRTTLREVEAERILTPRLVTLQKEGIPLSKALDELTKQAGTRVEDMRGDKTADPTLKLKLEKATFWQAVDAIAKEADLRVLLDHKEGKVMLGDGPNRTAPGSVSYSGLFRIAVKRIQADQDLESDKEGHFCVVHLEVAWEPRFRPLFLESQPDSFEIKDDKGNVLKALEQGGGRVPLGQRNAAQLQVRVEAPPRTALNLGLLKGSLNVLGPTKMVLFNFDKLAKTDKSKPPPSQVKDGIKLTLREFGVEGEKDDQLWRATLMLEYPEGGPEFESFEQWLVNNAAWLENADGKRRIETGNSDSDVQGRQAILNYFFDKEGMGKPEDWKLVYRTPGPILKVPVNFEFKELPLP
jgi:hypothetical protein